MKHRIILVGKAASGKDYFRDYLNQHLIVDVSCTTRPPRDGEIDGYTYNFISENAFQNMILGDQFHEQVGFNGWYYGTTKESWEESDVFIMTPSGVKQIPSVDRASCTIVYFDMKESIRKDRLAKRSDADKVSRRLIADRNDFRGFCDFDIRVKNPTYDAKRLLDLIYQYRGCATKLQLT